MDGTFRKELFAYWLVNDANANQYLASTFPDLTPSRYTKRQLLAMARSPYRTKGDLVSEEHFEDLLARFRSYFPDCTRNGLTLEFKKIINMIARANPSLATKKSIHCAEFQSAITSVKPEMLGKFSDEDYEIIFNYIDQSATSQINLFEFVIGVRVSTVIMIFILIGAFTFHKDNLFTIHHLLFFLTGEVDTISTCSS